MPLPVKRRTVTCLAIHNDIYTESILNTFLKNDCCMDTRNPLAWCYDKIFQGQGNFGFLSRQIEQ